MPAPPAPLSGELTFATADKVLERARAALAGEGALELDLSGVTRADSAGVALLLQLTRDARARGRSVRFTHAPAQLARLAEFFGVAQILALTA
jgi:phospholipid transport system transporter-binding protein